MRENGKIEIRLLHEEKTHVETTNNFVTTVNLQKNVCSDTQKRGHELRINGLAQPIFIQAA